jgi:hypothetical protein
MDEILVLKLQLRKLTERLDALEQRRIGQGMVLPGAIKQRLLGEGNRFIRSGLAVNRPTVGEPVESNSSAYYFATDTGVLSAWNGTVWVSTTLV